MTLKMNTHFTISDLKPGRYKEWDAYVDKHPEGTFFHLSGWHQIAKEVFDHTPYYLVAYQNDCVVGVLPLVEQKSMLFGHALVSIPFCVFGGTLADSDFIQRQLENEAITIGKNLRVDYIELRDRSPSKLTEPWIKHCHHATFSCDIADTPDTILTSVKRKQRAVIRHSLKNNLSADHKDNVDACYDVYAESVRNLGTPVFDRQLFRKLKEVFGDKCDTLIVYDDQKQPVSSVMSFYYRDTVLPYYGGGTPSARGLKSSDFMYYKLMCYAREKGFTTFDFGRSKIDSGAYAFKKNWGMQENELHYRIALIEADSPPNLSPNNPKYKLVISAWQKMPLWLSKIIGPYLSKYLG